MLIVSVLCEARDGGFLGGRSSRSNRLTSPARWLSKHGGIVSPPWAPRMIFWLERGQSREPVAGGDTFFLNSKIGKKDFRLMSSGRLPSTFVGDETIWTSAIFRSGRPFNGYFEPEDPFFFFPQTLFNRHRMACATNFRNRSVEAGSGIPN